MIFYLTKSLNLKFLKKTQIMEDYLQELNTDQRKAVIQINGASMVIAGAGSGKTRVLTYKIAHLLKNVSSLPKIKDGRMILASGKQSRTPSSPAPWDLSN